ncbi:MAG: ribosomal protein S6 modification protein [Planctomycetota bacterium]|nr:MAG: ribosomal protein S6 modification protein [Planctomycetota bacterium]
MPELLVVNTPENWPLDIPGVPVVSAREYLTDPAGGGPPGTKVFNLCRSYRYQSSGYYVSLLAEARGHRPLPSLQTIQELKSPGTVRLLSEEVDELIQQSLARLRSTHFALSIYFGKNLARRYERLSLQLFNLFPAPLLRAHFVKDQRWRLERLAPIAASDIPPGHRAFVVATAREYLARRWHAAPRRKVPRYTMAILHDPDELHPPSQPRTLQKFVRVARRFGIAAELITRDDFGRLAEYDALFIRATTAVNHYTFRFAQRAQASGLVVVDDPRSIIRCSNKVYLAELLRRHRIPTPETLIVYRDNLDQVGPALGFPCVLKQPDSSFSQGVIKIEDEAALHREAARLLERSDLILAQRFVPTAFDWRVGVLDGRVLHVCRYHMAKDDWRIIGRDRRGRLTYGRADAVAAEEAPRRLVQTAVRAANLVGDGLYGVDVKQTPDGRVLVIEINDNPNLDVGCEDAVLKDALYERVLGYFHRRLEARAEGRRAV